MNGSNEGQGELFAEKPASDDSAEQVDAEQPHQPMSVDEARAMVEEEDEGRLAEAEAARSARDRAEATDREQRGGVPYPGDIQAIRHANNPAIRIRETLDKQRAEAEAARKKIEEHGE